MKVANDRRPSYHGYMDIPEGKSGNFSIEHVTYPAGSTLNVCNIRTAFHAGHLSKQIKYPDKTRWHRLCEGEGIWMTDLPIEQWQLDQSAKHFYGRVLIGGLGLGYAAQRIHMKNRVSEVVCVELEQDVINLVGEHVKRRKCKPFEIVQADLFDYLKNCDRKFDWAFYDIWASDGERTLFETVFPLRELSRGIAPDAHVTCWNEDVMRGQLSMGLMQMWVTLKASQMEKDARDRIGLPSFTIEELVKEKDDIWWDWAVPFWQWYQRNQDVSDDTFQQMKATYASIYGRPGWQNAWALVQPGGR